MLNHQHFHPMMPSANHDELARQLFVLRLREYVAGDLQPANKMVFERQVEPAFERQHGRKPARRAEVRAAMERHPFHQAWSALNVTTQEMIWESVQTSIDRQIDDLNERAASVKARRGTLRLDRTVEAPRYLTAVDIHRMPGNYHTEYEPGDVYQAALFDRGAFIYGRGGQGPFHAKRGEDVVRYLRKVHPNLKPKRILDMGCTVGASTIPVARAFPNAEVHAIDISAPCVRYGHARAEFLGVPIHFSQQDCEKTDFADGSFDVVFSCILLHETSGKALRNYLRESHRLLKPGGVALHMDFSRYAGKSPYDQFMGDWSTHHNHEPFIAGLGDTDVAAVARQVGFSSNKVSLESMSRYTEPGNHLFVLDARR
ncbi:MAG: class I SAM-dependent methyltransferase [Alphaproteobacteria bacterium]|nr:class I SAM-dependent methyltransferase [Alphaproteobacteria bacterium]